MIQFSRARSGDTTPLVNGRSLHSRVDPAREAARYIESQLPEIPACVIVIGPGLGYLCRAIMERRPGCNVVAFHLATELHDRTVIRVEHAWHPGSAAEPEAFLVDAMHPVETASVAVIEWPAVTHEFPEPARRIRAGVATALARLQAGLVTEASAGRRWLRNSVANYTRAEPFVPRPNDRRVAACVIGAAGPSLERCIPLLVENRDSISLWALGSAVEPLAYAGITPDLVVTTDASPYATLHLRSIVRGTASPERRPMIVAPLSASRGTHTGGVHVIAQGDEFEDMLLGSGRHDVSYAPAAGTVAATALRLAVTFSEWPIVYAGLDMARYRGRTHARPHLAHAVRSAAATRTLPPETQVYHLQGPAGGDWQTERSLDAYAAWFRSRPAALARAQRLFPSPVPVSMAEMTPSAFGRLPRRYSGMTWQPAVWPDRGERRRTVHDVVARCRTMLGAFTGGATPRDAVVRNRPAVLLALRLAPQHAVRWYRGDEAAGGIVRETVERELNALEEMCP